MGRAQVVQAEAAGIDPDVRMNPVLLKPTSDRKSQVVLWAKSLKIWMRWIIMNLSRSYCPKSKKFTKNWTRNTILIIPEGAGSPAEIN